MAYLHPIATVLPESAYAQSDILEHMSRAVHERKLSRLMAGIYRHSAIEQRHSVLRDFDPSSDEAFYFAADGSFKVPTTKERNARYREEASRLFVCAAQQALQRCPWLAPQGISHIITASCTGFFAPGPEYLIVRALGLSADTPRYHLGFMGCYAAFPALELAASLCRADADAKVLVVCLELCTLHLQPQNDLDAILAASLFADGAAAAVVSNHLPEDARAFQLDGFSSQLVPEGEADMAWNIGDTGFEMVLSSYVPNLLAQGLADLLEPHLHEGSAPFAHWAVHPGGRAILDAVEDSLSLAPEQLAASRRILARYGNMSSPTVLFVLQDILRCSAPGERVFGLAFGPGLTVASGQFTRV